MAKGDLAAWIGAIEDMGPFRMHPDGTLYVYDPAYHGTGGYRTRNGGVGDLTEGLLPAFQGFFVRAVSEDAALTIPERAVAGNQAYYSRTAPPAALRFEVQGEDASAVAAAFVRFDERAALGVDPLDSFFLAPFADAFVAFSSRPLAGADTDGDGEAEYPSLTLNTLPVPSAHVEVELSVEAVGAEDKVARSHVTHGRPTVWRR